MGSVGRVEKRKAAVRDPDSLEVRRPNLASRKSVTMSIIQFCYQRESEINKIAQLVGETLLVVINLTKNNKLVFGFTG